MLHLQLAHLKPDELTFNLAPALVLSVALTVAPGSLAGHHRIYQSHWPW
jgi:hypothetical protein